MRDYLSPAKRVMSEAIARAIRFKSIQSKQGVYVSAGVAALLTVTLIAFVMVRANASQAVGSTNNSVLTTQTATPDTAVTSTVEKTDEVIVGEESPMTSQDTSSNASSNSASDTKITINNENIPVPENGTVHRTIQSDNGTTNVSVSVGSGTTSNQTTTSTSMNVNTSTFTHNTNIRNSSQ